MLLFGRAESSLAGRFFSALYGSPAVGSCHRRYNLQIHFSSFSPTFQSLTKKYSWLTLSSSPEHPPISYTHTIHLLIISPIRRRTREPKKKCHQTHRHHKSLDSMSTRMAHISTTLHLQFRLENHLWRLKKRKSMIMRVYRWEVVGLSTWRQARW